jgi:predicted MFS family arabinose efflux permease
VSSLTTEKNRTSAVSLIFSIGVGSSALGGAVCGYLPQWLARAGLSLGAVDVKRLILIASSALAALGLFAILRLRLPLPPSVGSAEPGLRRAGWLRSFRAGAFLWRFLPCMALWTALLGAFTPFANVYLSRDLHIPLTRIGLIFSVVQVVQLCSGLLVPMLVRRLGMMNAIVATQLGTAVFLALMAGTQKAGVAIALYLAFSATQWMSSPGLYTLLMNETAEDQRSSASALVMFCNNLASSATTAGAGILLTRFGYTPVLLGIAGCGLSLAVLCRVLLTPNRSGRVAQPPVGIEAVMD